MTQEEDTRSLEAKFAAAVKVMRSLPDEGPFQPSDSLVLMFHSYHQQATLGPCDRPRPISLWDTRGKAEWDAWSSLGNMSREEAMRSYVEVIQLILETIPVSDEVSDLVQKLGNFYTEADGEGGDSEENEADRRPFTRPFAQHADDLIGPFQKPTMEGYGDLWEDMQDVQEDDKHSSVHGNASEEHAEGSPRNSEMEGNEECSDWKSEEEENGDEGDYEDEDEHDWDCDPRLTTRWMSSTGGSSSSMEPSMSSFSDGTRSSLNSEMEDSELACFIEPSVQHNPDTHFDGAMIDHNDVPDRNHRSADSDNEEFCDSMEHLAMEEGLPRTKMASPGAGAASVRPKALCFESDAALNGGEDQILTEDLCLKEGISSSRHNSSFPRGRKGPPSPGATFSSQQRAGGDASWSHPVGAGRQNVNKQIAGALLRLQRDMAAVLHRLHTLEALTLSQSRSSSPRQEDSPLLAKNFMRPSWWPFDLCPLTVVLTALWPLIAHWLVQVYLQRKRRKIP